MNLEKLEVLDKGLQEMYDFIKNVKSFTVFTDEEVKENQDAGDGTLAYEGPQGFYIDKWSNYIEGAIQSVEDGAITLFLLGEEFGEKKTIAKDEVFYHIHAEAGIELIKLIIEDGEDDN
jgi:hypothetical protein